MKYLNQLFALFLVSLFITGCNKPDDSKEIWKWASILPGNGTINTENSEYNETKIIDLAMNSNLGNNGFYGKFVASANYPTGITEIPINDLIPEIIPGNSGIPETSNQTLLANGVVALKSISLLQRAKIEANLFTLAHCKGFFGKESCKGFKAELTFGKEAQQEINYISKADTISMDKNSKILGKAYANEYKLKSNSQISERITPIGNLPLLPKFLIGTTSETNIYARKNTTLEPGSYKSILVSPGIQLNLREGYYQIKSLYLNYKSSLICNGTCVITIKDDLITLPNTLITAASGDSKDLLIYSQNADYRLWIFSKPAVIIGNKSNLIANIYSPYGTIVVNDSTSIKGTLIGKDISIGKNAKVYDTYIGQNPSELSYDTLTIPINRISIINSTGQEYSIHNGQKSIIFNKDFSNNIAESIDFPNTNIPASLASKIRFYINGEAYVNNSSQEYKVKFITDGNQNYFDAIGEINISSGKLTELRIRPSNNFSMLKVFDTEYLLTPKFEIEQLRYFGIDKLSLVERYVGEDSKLLIQNSDTIVDANVIDLSSNYETIEGHQLITTIVTIKTNDIFLDEDGGLTRGDSISVKSLGGEVGDVKLFSPHTASFSEGERSLVFLRTINGIKYVTFGPLGKIKL
ncbi:hypothetical protein [Leptospira levettii]|uniref:hypothetical protein n=1 Tax=Leptospira levettii TaxID=2023178 RepID=UPI001082BB6E|nr:hypothetical protein [Leptospira levettii]TGK92570.1 hypothetical protein EHQ34_18320 [Leptospira levettii]